MADRRPLVAIVGSPSLLGRELREVLAERRLPASIKLIGAEDEDTITLTEHAGEPVVMTSLDEESLSEAQVVVLAGSRASSRKVAQMLERTGSAAALLDLTASYEDSPRARLRAPMLEPPGFRAPAATIHVVAHPAAIALALLLTQLSRRHALRNAVAHVFEPASERGREGVEELKEQTVSLLTFKGLPKRVFDEQLGFNLLIRYGSSAPEALEEVEQRIERHLVSLLAIADGPAPPSLRLIQAPVFHGHSFSVWVEFEQDPDPLELEKTLARPEFDVRGRGTEAPNAVGFAGQSGVAVGAIEADRNNPRAAWFWMVADNLRLAAENAVEVLAQIVGSESAT
ncbi:MAG: Asd/ArgC dimerization domain-containing protein [Bryobacterales bacterium]|nr:Asd/ArgC dimerization domain-containing protein [Bryobacteraceae bacterium]MDW8131360.1 Asd/ArgC dimerization domain-containing protein [Bryobacterales bacterium]